MELDILAYVTGAATILGLVLAIARKVVSLTPSTKDDEVVEKVASVAEPIIDALDGDAPPRS